MKTEFEKMRSGEMYSFADGEISDSIVRAQKMCARLRLLSIHSEEYRALIEELIPDIPSSSTICPPFHCDHGTGIVLGENVFINYNAVMLDGGYIRIGRNTKIGPNAQFYTPNHPLDYLERRKPQEIALPITVGEDCWIAGGVTICPGVSIGNRCVVAAGSVVTQDVPDDTLVAGCPAVVKRKLSE